MSLLNCFRTLYHVIGKDLLQIYIFTSTSFSPNMLYYCFLQLSLHTDVFLSLIKILSHFDNTSK